MGGNNIPEDAFILIIGAMKCGTSSLYNYIVEHPEICPCLNKEPEFFSKNQGHGCDVEKYENLWNFDPSIHKYVIEASTGYTKYPSESEVAKEIYEYGVKPKLIYVVRDPLDRIVSQYNHKRYRQNYGKRKDGLVDDNLIDISKYFTQLEQYRKFFSRDQILVLDFADIKNNPKSLLISVFDFLGIYPPDFVNKDQFSVHNKAVVLSRFEMFMRRNPQFSKPYALIPEGVRKAAKKILKKYSAPEKIIEFNDQEKKAIHDRLLNDMRRFHEEYGFNVKKWGFDI